MNKYEEDRNKIWEKYEKSYLNFLTQFSLLMDTDTDDMGIESVEWVLDSVKEMNKQFRLMGILAIKKDNE